MGALLQPLVSTEWLAAELGASDLVVFDASYYLPAERRDARAEHRAAQLSLDELHGHVLTLRADRVRLETDNLRLREQLVRLEGVENERDAAIVERDVARSASGRRRPRPPHAGKRRRLGVHLLTGAPPCH